MKIKDILRITGGKLLNPSNRFTDQKVSSFVIDSRKSQKGSFFIPLKGSNVDGHKFITDALKRGSVGYLTSRKTSEKNGILVEDTYKALVDIAKYKRKNFSYVIGITGTSGKTTTKDILKILLSQFFSVYGTEGNYNNEIGLPLTLANAHSSDICILEMGAGKIGDITYLSEIAKHDIAVLTSVGHGHTEKFGSFENVVKGKGEIFSVSEKAVLPYDLLKFYQKDLEGKSFITFGLKGDIKISDIKLLKEGTSGEISFKNEKIRFTVPVYNKALFFNIGAAAGVLYHLGYNPVKYLKVLQEFSVPEGRGNIIKINNLTVIDDTYNANPVSVRNAIETLSSLSGKKVIILGDMLELGDFSKPLHREIGKLIEKSSIDYALFFGKNMRYAFEETTKGFYFETKEELVRKLIEITKKEEWFVLVKGSRGMKMEDVIYLLQS
jgi:UDP-N-acetylmuramoyl-tripeptide--D-alanyl-D-alanine ligase